MMGKYDPLGRYLEQVEGESVNSSFAQIEHVLGFGLPQSAYRHQAWWANEAHGSHSHSRSWQDAGWETCQVNIGQRSVRFERRRRSVETKQLSSKLPGNHVGDVRPEIDDLLEKARMITGIQDRDTLLNEGLNALINRELAEYFTSLGGSMPDFKPAPRERSTV